VRIHKSANYKSPRLLSCSTAPHGGPYIIKKQNTALG
jgi:hypothetical protein